MFRLYYQIEVWEEECLNNIGGTGNEYEFGEHNKRTTGDSWAVVNHFLERQYLSLHGRQSENGEGAMEMNDLTISAGGISEVCETAFTGTGDLVSVGDGIDNNEMDDAVECNLLFANHNAQWQEVNDTTNLSVGIHSMRWEVSGTSDEHPLRLHTRHETALNSSYLNSYHWETGDFTLDWELPISSWSCDIDFEFDLDLQTVSSGTYRMDYETGDPHIDGPCGGGYDISQSEDPVDFSVSIIGDDGNADDLDEVHQLSEGENTFRWEVEDPVDGHFHSVWMYLWYNGKIQQTLSTGFLGDSQDASGEWVAIIDEDACDIRLHAEMSIREYNGWHEESTTEHFGVSGNTSDCDYAGSQVTLSVLDESGSWVESPDLLATGNNQIRLNVGDISLPENYSYYIQSQIDGSGVTSVGTHRYFNIGTPSYYGYSSYNEYDGGDIYYNFTVAEWTCTASAYLRIYIISSDGGWHTAATMPTRYYQNSDCEPIGELSLSRYEGEVWEHGLQNDWEIQAGTTDLYWNMTNLNIGERYKLSFYAYVDDQIYYSHSSGIYGTPSRRTRLGTSISI